MGQLLGRPSAAFTALIRSAITARSAYASPGRTGSLSHHFGDFHHLSRR